MTHVTCFFRWTKAGPVRVRRAHKGDGAPAWSLLYDAVHQNTSKHYTKRERDAWAPTRTPPERWETTLRNGTSLVAVGLRGRMLGFMTMGDDGYIDLAYVGPRQMGKGVADLLYRRIEKAARAKGIALLSTEASHLAKAFFFRRGWHLDARQDVIRDGVALTNFRMSKSLAS